MARYIRTDELLKTARNGYHSDFGRSMADLTSLREVIEDTPTADVVEVVRCKDCIYAVELDKHCDISRTAYRHCSLLRGDETQYVWHKYKKYYKDYSIVDLDGYCDSGELKEREKV
jgi:hypothetical protein